MKRLFVPDAWQGHGIGRALCAALIVAARDQGYVMMRLDTGNLLSEAIAMYRTFGFRTSAPHHEYPPELLPFMVFMELPLTPADGASA
jgi:GNAT superfamily N-acetyltransferase